MSRGAADPRTDSRRPLDTTGLRNVEPSDQKFALDRRDSGIDQREDRRRGRAGIAGDVQGAEQRAVGRIVHRSRGAAKGVDRPRPMLGGLHPYPSIELEREPGRVGAGVPLVPADALGEAHGGCAGAYARVALHPQQAAFGVADGDEQVVLHRVLHEQRPYDRHHCSERVLLTMLGEPLVGQVSRRFGMIGIDAELPAAKPGLEHVRAGPAAPTRGSERRAVQRQGRPPERLLGLLNRVGH